MTKGKKIGIAVIAIVLVLVITLIILNIPVTPERFSEEQHIERITKLVKKEYFGNQDEYGDLDGYKVFPMYDESDRFTHCIVEFKPSGFIYVSIQSYKPIQNIFSKRGMYLEKTYLVPKEGTAQYYNKEGSWKRYKICEEGEEPIPYQGIVWKAKTGEQIGNDWFRLNPALRFEVDENGEFVKHYDSPFQVAGVGTEKRYFLSGNVCNKNLFIPAVKRGNKFLNLISMEEFTYERGMDISKISNVSV